MLKSCDTVEGLINIAPDPMDPHPQVVTDTTCKDCGVI